MPKYAVSKLIKAPRSYGDLSLNPDQQGERHLRNLSLRDKAGFCLYLRELPEQSPLTPGEESKLLNQIHNHKNENSARKQILRSYLPLIIEIANDYRDEEEPVLDLVARGVLGLSKALTDFHPREEETIQTHAEGWIRDAIVSA